jgi:outer membrane protein assembly factor BamB
MVSAIVCCQGLIAVAGWLGAVLATGVVSGRTEVRTGQPAVVWHLPGEGRGTPAVRGDVAYFLAKRHELVAVDLATGTLRWRRPTDGPGETTAGSAVVAFSRTVVAGDGGLIAFTHSGREAWRFRPEDEGLVGVYLGDGTDTRVFTGSVTGRLWAVDVSTGLPAWSVPVVSDGRTTVFAPIVSGPFVIAGFTSFGNVPRGGLVCVDASSGRVRWRTWLPSARRSDVGRAFAGGPIAAGHVLVAASQNGAIHAFEAASGAVAWSLPPSSPPALSGSYEYRSIAITGRSLVASSLGGLVTAYDLISRRERWRRRPVDASVVFGIATDGRAVYVPYLSGRLVALDIDDGEERWRTSDPSSDFSWRPLVAAGRVLAASSSAGFFAFRP